MDNLLLLLYFTVGKVKYCFFFFFLSTFIFSEYSHVVLL